MTQCITCHFYDRHNLRVGNDRSVQWGLCRREPPRLNTVNAKSHAIEGVWPTVRDDDWCGQWQAQHRRAVDASGQAVVIAAAPPPAARPPGGAPIAIVASSKPGAGRRTE